MGWPDDRDRATLAFMNQASQRALLVRPLALGVGALAAVGLSEALRSGLLVAWNVAIFGGFGLVCWLVRDVRFASRFVLLASPVSSLLGWGTLALFTRGLESPFLAAFFLEVALSAVAMGPRGVLWVTANAIGVLGLIELLFGFADGWPLLLLEGGSWSRSAASRRSWPRGASRGSGRCGPRATSWGRGSRRCSASSRTSA